MSNLKEKLDDIILFIDSIEPEELTDEVIAKLRNLSLIIGTLEFIYEENQWKKAQK